jgi:endonuclease I
MHCIIAVLISRYYNDKNGNIELSSEVNTMQETHQSEKNTISGLSSQGYQEVAAELSKMTSEQADIVISNSNIKLFVKK